MDSPTRRLLIVADGRSSHLHGWLPSMREIADQVLVASTFRVDAPSGETEFKLLPGAWSWAESHRGASEPRAPLLAEESTLKTSVVDVVRTIDSRSLMAHGVSRIIRDYRPTLVHAMRTNFEGFAAVAGARSTRTPVVLSIWGQDFVRDAARSTTIRKHVGGVLGTVAGVHADCGRDIQLAHALGLPGTVPTIVAPSAGGIAPLSPFRGEQRRETLSRILGVRISGDTPVVLYARGLRSHVRTQTFLDAIEHLAPDLDFLAVGLGLQGHRLSETVSARLDGRLVTAPIVAHAEVLDLMRCADVTVSPSSSDGTPNSMLESMACGAVPVATPMEGVCEWVTDGEGALLRAHDDVDGFAQAIRQVLSDFEWAARARGINHETIGRRASPEACRQMMSELYQSAVRPRI